MTRLEEVFRTGKCKLPESFFKDPTSFQIYFESERDRQAASVVISDKDRNRILSMALPEHYLEDILTEAVMRFFQEILPKGLTGIDPSVYTVKEEEVVKVNAEDLDPDRPEFDVDAPAVQPGRMVRPPRFRRREYRWVAGLPGENVEIQQENTRNGWLNTGRTRPLPNGGARATQQPAVPNEQQEQPEPARAGGIGFELDQETFRQLWRG